MDTTTSITLGTTAAADYEPFTGFDEVISGDPAAGVAWLRTTATGDGMLLVGMFRVSPSTFRYTFAGDESFHVLAGDLDVEVDGGDVVRLGAGDIASFPGGVSSTWTVRRPLTKFFVISG